MNEMKKNRITKLATSFAISTMLLGTVVTIPTNLQQRTVQASNTRVILRRKTYVYNYKGRRTKQFFKKNKHLTYISSKWIRGYKFYRIGRNKYVLQNNTRPAYLFNIRMHFPSGDVYYRKPNIHAKQLGWIDGTYSVYEETYDSQGNGWYRIGKNAWVRAKDTNRPLSKNIKRNHTKQIKKNRKTGNSASVKYNSSQNAVSLMNYLANNDALTEAQKQAAATAATLLKTGQIEGQEAPFWFNQYVNLGAKRDATSAANIKASLKYLAEVNQAREKAGVGTLKVSPISTAISMIDADYQKQGGLNHPQYYKYADNLENLSAGADPVTKWLEEKSAWKANVRKNPALADNEFTPDWGNEAYTEAIMGTDGYRMAGHYTNLLNSQHRVMGMAHMTQNNYGFVDAFNATGEGEDGAISLDQYRDLINQWLKK